jgi:hypothetical protein
MDARYPTTGVFVKKNERLRDASDKLIAAICPSGVSYRPIWFTSLGVDEKNGVLIVYAKVPRLAYKSLQNVLTPEKKFQGFRVVVKKMGPPRLL